MVLSEKTHKGPVCRPQVWTFFELDYNLDLIGSSGSFQYFMRIYSWNHLENINWSRSGSEIQVLSKAQKPQKWWKRRKFTYFTQFKWVKWPKIGSIALKASTHILYWLINLKRSKFKSKQGKWVLTIYWKMLYGWAGMDWMSRNLGLFTRHSFQ